MEMGYARISTGEQNLDLQQEGVFIESAKNPTLRLQVVWLPERSQPIPLLRLCTRSYAKMVCARDSLGERKKNLLAWVYKHL